MDENSANQQHDKNAGATQYSIAIPKQTHTSRYLVLGGHGKLNTAIFVNAEATNCTYTYLKAKRKRGEGRGAKLSWRLQEQAGKCNATARVASQEEDCSAIHNPKNDKTGIKQKMQ